MEGGGGKQGKSQEKALMTRNVGRSDLNPTLSQRGEKQVGLVRSFPL